MKMKRYTQEFKEEALGLLASGVGVAQAAKDLGVAEQTLYAWRQAKRAHGKDAFVGKGYLRPEDEALRKLQRENVTLKMEVEILKKAAAYFAKASDKGLR
jgi:transposase